MKLAISWPHHPEWPPVYVCGLTAAPFQLPPWLPVEQAVCTFIPELENSTMKDIFDVMERLLDPIRITPEELGEAKAILDDARNLLGRHLGQAGSPLPDAQPAPAPAADEAQAAPEGSNVAPGALPEDQPLPMDGGEQAPAPGIIA
jgi:hypothetical protein